MTREELIARLEAATEGSRELDARIWWLTDRAAAERVYWNAATGLPRPLPDEMPAGLGRLAVECYAPAFTSCTDTALKLVPSDKPFINFTRFSDGWYATIRAHSLMQRSYEGNQKETPALALVIAALKAAA